MLVSAILTLLLHCHLIIKTSFKINNGHWHFLVNDDDDGDDVDEAEQKHVVYTFLYVMSPPY